MNRGPTKYERLRFVLKPRKFNKGERPFQKFRRDEPPFAAADQHDKPYKPAFRPGARPDRHEFGEDMQYTASGIVAEVVGSMPLDRHEVLRRMWRYYLQEGLVKAVPGGPRVPRDHDERPERRPREFTPRSSEGPRRFSRDGEDRPRRFERRTDDRPRPFTRSSEGRPRTSPLARKPAGKHPTARKSAMIEKAPRRKFKETRERNEG
jgi:hypothetical protein